MQGLGYCNSIMKPIHVIPLVLSALIAISCGSRSEGPKAGEQESLAETGTELDQKRARGEPLWYWFSEAGIHFASNPAEIPSRPFVPWTEAVRAVDAGMIDSEPALLINRLGIMTSVTGESALYGDQSLFTPLTAAGMYRSGDSELVRLYRNSVFSPKPGSQSAPDTAGVFLARFAPEKGTYSAYLTASDLGLPREAQCVALDRIGSMWYAAFKWDSGQRVEFAYLEFPAIPGKDPSGSVDVSNVRKIDAEAYQTSVAPFPFSAAPEQLQKALGIIPADAALAVKVYSSSGGSTQRYLREGAGMPLQGTAFLSDTRTSILFEDGTFYDLSSEAERGETKGNPLKALKLPSLSPGYVYSSFMISNSTLIAAWEEQRFYETGRSGLLEIPIDRGYN